MKAIIVEDELLAAQELEDALGRIAPEVAVVATARSVAQAVRVVASTAHDIIFMDVHLGDGNSFEIFKKTAVTAPVIFITAYDTYTMEAFRNQGVDYLLKPFSDSELRRAIDKLLLLSSAVEDKTTYQERFLISVGAKLRSISTSEIAYFMADGKYLHLITSDGGNYIVDSTITTTAARLNPNQFFQINRKFIISFNSISEMFRHTNNRIKVVLNPTPQDNLEAVVSNDRVSAFREWLNR